MVKRTNNCQSYFTLSGYLWSTFLTVCFSLQAMYAQNFAFDISKIENNEIIAARLAEKKASDALGDDERALREDNDFELTDRPSTESTFKQTVRPGEVSSILDSKPWAPVNKTQITATDLTSTPEIRTDFFVLNERASTTTSKRKVRHKSLKKGVAFGSAVKSHWAAAFDALDPAWHYSWGRIVEEEHPEGLEFVPQFWGKNSVTLEAVKHLKPFILSGKVKYIMGFNEPDLESQANMTVAEAVTKWQLLEQYLEDEGLLDKVELISPVVAHHYASWLQDFLQQAERFNLKVDYVGLHLYTDSGINTSAKFINRLTKIYKTYAAPYGKKIWLKEFSVRDGDAKKVGDNIYAPEFVFSFMTQVIPFLETTDWVFRYAWFSNVVNGHNYPKQETSVLFDTENGASTPLGDFYSEIFGAQ
jgi:hypothetical protein